MNKNLFISITTSDFKSVPRQTCDQMKTKWDLILEELILLRGF